MVSLGKGGWKTDLNKLLHFTWLQVFLSQTWNPFFSVQWNGLKPIGLLFSWESCIVLLRVIQINTKSSGLASQLKWNMVRKVNRSSRRALQFQFQFVFVRDNVQLIHKCEHLMHCTRVSLRLVFICSHKARLFLRLVLSIESIGWCWHFTVAHRPVNLHAFWKCIVWKEDHGKGWRMRGHFSFSAALMDEIPYWLLYTYCTFIKYHCPN